RKEEARRTDIASVQALPKELLDWRQTVEFLLGPFGCSKDLSEISAIDFARAIERDSDALCRQGLGTLIAKLADGLPVELGGPVKKIDLWSRRGVEIETAGRGYVTARGVIVTASTAVLAAGKIKFDPDPPKRYLDAMNSLRLGSYDRIVLELPNNPLGLDRDDLVFEN